MASNPVSQIDLHSTGARLKLDELTIDTSQGYTRISALLQNIGYLAQAIQQLQVASISYINFAGLISIGALTVGIIRPVPLVEIFAPYGLSIVFIFLIQLYTDIERLTTIKEVFEGEANCLMRAGPAFLGLNEASSKYRGRWSVRLISALLAIPLVIFIVHSRGAMAALVSSPKEHHHSWWVAFQVGNYIGLVFCLITIAWASCEMLRAHKKAILEAKQTLKPEKPETPKSGRLNKMIKRLRIKRQQNPSH
jgi:hypothetical protein